MPEDLDEQIAARVTPSEKRAAVEVARRRGTDVSALIRGLLRQDPDIVALLPEDLGGPRRGRR